MKYEAKKSQKQNKQMEKSVVMQNSLTTRTYVCTNPPLSALDQMKQHFVKHSGERGRGRRGERERLALMYNNGKAKVKGEWRRTVVGRQISEQERERWWWWWCVWVCVCVKIVLKMRNE